MKPIRVFLFGSLFLCGCASTGTHPAGTSASGSAIPLEALQQADAQVTSENIPTELKPYYLALYTEGPQNSVLHEMKGGLAALRLERYDLAKQLFDHALKEVEALQEGAKQAERAKSKFVEEREKWFKGESYERAALYFYRGLVYLHDHDFGNAAACFKRSQLQDIKGEEMKDLAGDWYSDEWGLALASHKNGFPQDAKAALERAEKFPNRQGNVPPPQPDNNLLIMVETGDSPRKYRAGNQGQELHFSQQPSSIKLIACQLNDHPSLTTAAAENLYVQATTRGTRQVDYILHGKAAFKEGAGMAAVGLGAAAIAAAQTERSGIAAGALGALALGSAIASVLTKSRADIRAWENLPDAVFLVGLTLSPGNNVIKIKGLDSSGNTLKEKTVELHGASDSRDPLRIITIHWQ